MVFQGQNIKDLSQEQEIMLIKPHLRAAKIYLIKKTKTLANSSFIIITTKGILLFNAPEPIIKKFIHGFDNLYVSNQS